MSTDATDTPITYAVTGMTCGHCELAVREAVEALPGVASATADRETGTVVVVGPVSSDAIASAVEDAGYAITR